VKNRTRKPPWQLWPHRGMRGSAFMSGATDVCLLCRCHDTVTDSELACLTGYNTSRIFWKYIIEINTNETNLYF
jgi:hypothetical protein